MMKLLFLFFAFLDLALGRLLRPVYSVDYPFDNVTSESVEIDSYNNLLFYSSFFAGIVYVADYNATKVGLGIYDFDNVRAMDNNGYKVQTPTGMYSDGTYLYVLSANTTYITAYAIANETAVAQLAIQYEGQDTRLNGICNDPTDSDIVYVTAPGADFVVTGTYTNDSALYWVNLTSLSVIVCYLSEFSFF